MPPAVLIQPVTCCLRNSPGEQQRLPVSCWTSFSLERGPHLPWFWVVLLGNLLGAPLWPTEGTAVSMRLFHCALETEGKGTHSDKPSLPCPEPHSAGVVPETGRD